MREWHDVVMDREVNPLTELRKPRRFTLMALLSVPWPVIFCLAFAARPWSDELMLAVLTGIAIAALTFGRPRRDAAPGPAAEARRGRP